MDNKLHRTQGYNEMSARYAPLPDDNYTPSKERLFASSKSNKQAGTAKGSVELTEDFADSWLKDIALVYDCLEQAYQEALQNGIPKELARIVLPVGRYSQMRATACLRNWLGFLTLRDSKFAQFEIQQYAKAVDQIISEIFPKTHAIYHSLKEVSNG